MYEMNTDHIYIAILCINLHQRYVYLTREMCKNIIAMLHFSKDIILAYQVTY